MNKKDWRTVFLCGREYGWLEGGPVGQSGEHVWNKLVGAVCIAGFVGFILGVIVAVNYMQAYP